MSKDELVEVTQADRDAAQLCRDHPLHEGRRPVSEAEKRADELSLRQKDALKQAAECKGGEFWTPYQRYFTRADRDLVMSGRLTTLGLAVRQALQSQDKRR